jgi:ribosomal protein L19
MLCFVPDGNRIVKLKDLLLINSINTPNPDRKQQVIKIIESIRAGDEIILINMTTNSVYIAVVKLVTNNENDDHSYKIYINKLRKIGRNKLTAIRSLIFKTQIENLVDTYKPAIKPNKYHYKNIKNETYKGYGMRGLRKTNQKEAYEREQAWLERLNNNKLWSKIDYL